MNSKPAKTKRVTAPSLIQMKNEGRKITMLTAYDFNMAATLDAAGVDVFARRR